MSCMACEGGSKMRVLSSCTGCRALRKGCSEHCTIRPCLEWITTPEAQANATVFLAKFYGRAGLLNLIAATPADARPAVFRSLIYEACGRIVNPVSGAVGLLWSDQWDKCVHAVDAMFKGELGVPVDAAVQAHAASEAGATPPPLPPLRARLGPSAAAYDIRHKDSDAAAAADLLRFARAGRGRKGPKRAGSSSSSSSNANLVKGGKGKVRGIAKLLQGMASSNKRATSPSPPLGQAPQQQAEELEPVPMAMELLGSKENADVEAVGFHVIQAEAEPPVGRQVLAADHEGEEEVGLELTLG